MPADKAPDLAQYTEPGNMEYAVRVSWTKTLPREQAVKEKGLFANQNSMCKLRSSLTLERLTERLGLDSLSSQAGARLCRAEHGFLHAKTDDGGGNTHLRSRP